MAGVLNKTARQFNLKCISPKNQRITVRVVPGFNIVDDEYWSAFVRPASNKGEKDYIDPYVAELAKNNMIAFGEEIDDMELDTEPVAKTKSKSEEVKKETKSEKE